MNGFIVIDKPSGITSFKVVDIIKKKFGLKKVGHAGTLDPLATGVLILAIGKATKQITQLIEDNKAYEATLLLGVQTDSQDITGEIITAYKGEVGVSEDKIEEVFSCFKGKIKQVPPMVSALKHKGKRLYKLARQGKTIEREPRNIEILDLEIRKIQEREISFYVKCSKGTYVRTLCADIGKRLGYGGVMSALRRVSSGKIDISQALSLEMVKQMKTDEFEKVLFNISLK